MTLLGRHCTDNSVATLTIQLNLPAQSLIEPEAINSASIPALRRTLCRCLTMDDLKADYGLLLAILDDIEAKGGSGHPRTVYKYFKLYGYDGYHVKRLISTAIEDNMVKRRSKAGRGAPHYCRNPTPMDRSLFPARTTGERVADIKVVIPGTSACPYGSLEDHHQDYQEDEFQDLPLKMENEAVDTKCSKDWSGSKTVMPTYRGRLLVPYLDLSMNKFWTFLEQSLNLSSEAGIDLKFTLTPSRFSYQSKDIRGSKLLLASDFQLDETTFGKAQEHFKYMESCLDVLQIVHQKLKTITLVDDTIGTSAKLTVSVDKTFHGICRAVSLDGEQIKDRYLLINSHDVLIGAKLDKTNDSVQMIKKPFRFLKNFPISGAENFNLPVFVQSSRWTASSTDRGSRIPSPTGQCPASEANKVVFCDFVELYKTFIEKLSYAGVDNLVHLLDISQPDGSQILIDSSWYAENVINPIRYHASTISLIRTVSGQRIKFGEAVFPSGEQQESESLYRLLTQIKPDCCPEECSLDDWRMYLVDNHPSQKMDYATKDLLSAVQGKTLESVAGENPVAVLNALIQFLQDSNQADLLTRKRLLPNQRGVLMRSVNLFVDPGIDERLKVLAYNLGYNIHKELLHEDIQKPGCIDYYDIKSQLFSKLGSIISDISVDEATPKQVEMIFRLVSMFPLKEREDQSQWYELFVKLMPDFTLKRVFVSEMSEFDEFDACLRWSVEYICYLVQKCQNVQNLSKRYFKSDESAAWCWYDCFVHFVLKHFEDLAIDYRIIPIQEGRLRKLSSNIFREADDCDEYIKSWYNRFVGGENIERLLIDTKITVDTIPVKATSALTEPVDELFEDQECLVRVSNVAPHHKLFREINNWYLKNQSTAENLFPNFTRNRVFIIKSICGQDKEKMTLMIHGSTPAPTAEKGKESQLNVSSISVIKEYVQKFGPNRVFEKLKELSS